MINEHLDNGLMCDNLVHYVNHSDIWAFFSSRASSISIRGTNDDCVLVVQRKSLLLSLGDADGRRQKSRDGHCARDCVDAIGSRFFRHRGSSARPSAVAVDTVDRFDSLSVRLGFQSQLSAFEKKK